MATSEQVTSELPTVESYKLGLLKSAKALADQGVEIPPHMVAEMSDLQLKAMDLAQAGIGGYQPYLDQAGLSMTAGQDTIGSTMDMASPYQTEAASLMRDAAGNIQGGVGAAQQGMSDAVNYGQGITGTAIGGLDQAAAGARAAALRGQTASNAAGALIPGVMNTAQLGNNAALVQAAGALEESKNRGVGTLLGESLAQGVQSGRNIAGEAGSDTLGAINAARNTASLGSQALAQAGLSGAGIAAEAGLGARNLTNEAARSLNAAGALGLQSAQQGIAGLSSFMPPRDAFTSTYNPASANSYMNQYEDAAVQQALADIRRAGDIQQQSAAAQAVGAGAFGGSRQAIAANELDRSILEQQGRTAAGMRQQGFESASQRAQQAYEAQQARSIQAAQLTGAIGAQGAQSGISAANAAGQLGLSGEQLAGQLGMTGAQLQGQLAGQAAQMGVSVEQLAGQLTQQQAATGMSAEQMASANAQSLAQTGMNLQQLQVQTGLSAAQLGGQLSGQMGQLGLSGASQQANIAQQAAQMGISAEQLAGQLAGQAGSLGQSQAQMAMQGAQQSGALGLQGNELQNNIAQGIGNLGTSYGQLNLAQGSAQGQMGMQQGALGELSQTLNQKDSGYLFDVGKQQQAQDQANTEAGRQTKMEELYEPYQRVGFLSDIYEGAPTSQQTIAATTAPKSSAAQQILGLGVAGLSAAAGANRMGLF